MLSILIPTYNYNIFQLVSTIHKQVINSKIFFEIICIDDASPIAFDENLKINELDNVTFEVLQDNIGRSKIRNLLAEKAKYSWLLFLDADVLPENDNFIGDYLKYMDEEVKAVNGGLLYQSQNPEKNKLLRWFYGKSREALPTKIRNENPYLSFLTLNFLIHKSVFNQVSFNETIPNLRHEDTLFSYNLKQKNIKIVHVNNPVIHFGLDDFDIAIKKEKESLQGLKYLLDNNLIDYEYLKISKLYCQLKRNKITPIVAFFYKIFQSNLLKNLSSDSPSLFVFDIYRIGYLCSLKK